MVAHGKGRLPNVGDTGRNAEASIPTRWKRDERGPARVVNDSTETAIGRIQVRHCNRRQLWTSPESPNLDHGHAGGNRNVGQVDATKEGHFADAGNAAGDHVAARFGARVLNEQGLAPVEQHPVPAAVEGAGRVHADPSHTETASEDVFPDVGNAAGNPHAGQIRTLPKRKIPDGDHAAAQGHLNQAVATGERIAPQIRDAVSNGHAGQVEAAGKGGFPNVHHPLANGELAQVGAGAERAVSHTEEMAADGHVGQASAASEGGFAQVGHGVRNGNAGQTRALRKRPTSDARDAVWDHKAGEIRTMGKRKVTNAPDTTAEGGVRQAVAEHEHRGFQVYDTPGDGDVAEAGTVSESRVANAGNRVAKGHSRHAVAKPEGMVPDVRNAVWHDHLGQHAAKPKRALFNADDAAGNTDAPQPAATRERRLADPGHRVRDRISAKPSARIHDQCGLAEVKQHPIHATVRNIERVHRELEQVVAESKGVRPDAGYAGRNLDPRQDRAALKSRASDARDAIRDHDFGQHGAGCKCFATDGHHAGGNSHVHQAVLP